MNAIFILKCSVSANLLPNVNILFIKFVIEIKIISIEHVCKYFISVLLLNPNNPISHALISKLNTTTKIC